MTTEHDTRTRMVLSWLREDAHENAERVLLAALDEIDHTRQRRSWWPAWRFPDMNALAKVLAATAAVVVVAVAAINLLPGGRTDIGTAPSAMPSPTPAPTPAPTPGATPSATAEGGLPEGPHLILSGQADDPTENHKPLTVTIPAPGWDGEVGGGILTKNDRRPPDGAGMIIFVGHEYTVYGDACHWKTTLPDSPVTTVDEFVAALSSQGSRTALKPVDITLGGYAGKSITLRVPDDVDFAGCDPGYGGSWDCGGDGMQPCGWHTGSPTEIDTVYILDVEGQVMAWLTNYHTGTSAEDVGQLEAIVQSASFGD